MLFHFAPRPLKVTKEYWDTMLYCYPGLAKETFFLRLMQYITHGPCDKDTGQLVITEGMVRAMAGCRHKGTSVKDLLRWFEREVGLKLNLQPWDYEGCKARTMAPHLNTTLVVALMKENDRVKKRGDNEGLVWYHTGKSTTNKNERNALQDYEKSLLEIAAQMPDDHSGYELVNWLHTQTPRQVEEQIQRTGHLVWSAIMDMPGKTWSENGVVLRDRDQERKDYALNHFHAMMQFPVTRYRSVKNTLRVFAQGCGLAMLPKKLRKLALAGCWELDLTAAQLGIVAKIWNCPKLRVFLANGGDVWQEFCCWLGVGEEAKGVVKQALYSIIFGSTKDGIRERWTSGHLWEEGFSTELCDRFLSHYIVKELLNARSVELSRIKELGGMFDAFGRWVDVSDIDKPSLSAQARSLLSAIVQSHELRIMLQAVPLLKSLNRVYPMVFLHDGLTIRLTGRTVEQEQTVCDKIAQVINDYCKSEGYLTKMTPERIPMPGE